MPLSANRTSHREVLGLWALHGLSYEQIAAVADTEVSSVKSRMNRARTTLKALVRGDRPIGGRAATLPPARPRPRPVPVPVAASPSAVPAPTPSSPGPILVRPALVVPAWPAAWLADAERRIVRTELLITRHRRIIGRLGRVGLPTVAAETALRLAEASLDLYQAHRRRLLDGDGGERPVPAPVARSPAAWPAGGGA